MESLAPFLQGTCTPYNMPVYPGAQCIIANALIDPGAACRLRLNRLSEPPLPADHSNFVHQQNDYGR